MACKKYTQRKGLGFTQPSMSHSTQGALEVPKGGRMSVYPTDGVGWSQLTGPSSQQHCPQQIPPWILTSPSMVAGTDLLFHVSPCSAPVSDLIGGRPDYIFVMPLSSSLGTDMALFIAFPLRAAGESRRSSQAGFGEWVSWNIISTKMCSLWFIVNLKYSLFFGYIWISN